MVVIVMENKDYGRIIGASDAPYENRLAKRYGLATSFYAERHPSLPNYLALIGGSTFGIDSDCTDCHVRARNLVDQLENAGISWKGYMQGMPSRCFTGSYSGRYTKKHNPFMYFDDIRKRPSRCRRVVPFSDLPEDLQADSLPRFVFITPNLCNDTHDCSVARGDRFLKRLVPKLLSAISPRGVLFLTWDEGSTARGCCRYARGGHIATIVAGETVRPGTRIGRGLDHYSILRAIEDSWGFGRLRRAGCRCTRPMSGFFETGLHTGTMQA